MQPVLRLYFLSAVHTRSVFCDFFDERYSHATLAPMIPRKIYIYIYFLMIYAPLAQ